jgi:hypothetical protein
MQIFGFGPGSPGVRSLSHPRSPIVSTQSEPRPSALQAAAAGTALATRELAAGGVIAVWSVINVVADAALIYSGPLSPGLLLGASALLAAFALASITIGLRSALPGMATTTACAIIYAGMAGAVDRLSLIHMTLPTTSRV